jgi:hypothetical protein
MLVRCPGSLTAVCSALELSDRCTIIPARCPDGHDALEVSQRAYHDAMRRLLLSSHPVAVIDERHAGWRPEDDATRQPTPWLGVELRHRPFGVGHVVVFPAIFVGIRPMRVAVDDEFLANLLAFAGDISSHTQRATATLQDVVLKAPTSSISQGGKSGGGGDLLVLLQARGGGLGGGLRGERVVAVAHDVLPHHARTHARTHTRIHSMEAAGGGGVP